MNNIYLTKELKEYYQTDFNEKVLKVTDSLYQLDTEAIEYLIDINKNENIQTLYSKYWKPKGFDISERESYLKFTYSGKVEERIFKETIPTLLTVFNDEELKSALRYYYYHPKVKEVNIECKIDMGCLQNPEYYNVNNIWLHFFSGTPDLHLKFWKRLAQELNKLG